MQHVVSPGVRVIALVLGLLVMPSASWCGTAGDTGGRTAGNYRDPHFDYFVAGNPAAPRAPHTQFGLLLMGGGGAVRAAFQALAERAGRGHIVILRAVSDDSFDPRDGDYGQSFMAEWGPVASAQTIVFHDRHASSDPRVLAVLRSADGIFLAGGDQANYVRYWKGTPVQALLNEHVAANRPIGGSSAGLAVLGHYSYTALDGGSLESRVALTDPYGTGVTLEDDLFRFSTLQCVITDSHFSARARLGRLVTFVTRLQAERQPCVFGIGIDERTSLLVNADGSAQIVVGSAGSAWVVHATKAAKLLAHSKPLAVDEVRVERLNGDGRLDVHTGRVTHPAEVASLSVDGGRVVGPPFIMRIATRDTVPPGED